MTNDRLWVAMIIGGLDVGDVVGHARRGNYQVIRKKSGLGLTKIEVDHD